MTDQMTDRMSAYVLFYRDDRQLLTNLRAKKTDFFNDFKDLTSFLRVLILRGASITQKDPSIYINIYIYKKYKKRKKERKIKGLADFCPY